ncbi:DegV family protein [Chloroflexota bacterium]
MSNVAIVADSTHCLPAELVKEYDIRVAPVSVVIGGKNYPDNTLTNDEFWKLFYQANGQTTTNAANLGDFVNIFSELADKTESIVCVVVSKGVSATHETAREAADLVKSNHPNLRVEIVDSKTSGGALGFIVLEAARAAKKGANIDEVVKVAQDMVPRVKFLIVMETLKYLIRGGRAPKVGYIGELMQVKPIIGFVSGSGVVDSLCRVRGNRKCMLRLAEMIKEYADTTKPINFMVHYTDGVEVGEELKDIISSEFKYDESYLTPLTPVMCSHTGPVVALSFYS